MKGDPTVCTWKMREVGIPDEEVELIPSAVKYQRLIITPMIENDEFRDTDEGRIIDRLHEHRNIHVIPSVPVLAGNPNRVPATEVLVPDLRSIINNV